MRKISLFLGILTSTISVFGYSSADVSNAEFLANQWIITSQSSAKWYRLDDNITRAEAVGIALKIKKVLLPNNYTCKNYFIDAPYNPSNNWICRAVELAKDNGIVSWENIKARPADPITRSEVLAMIMHAALNSSLSIVPKWYKFSTDTVEWQQNIFYAAEDLITVTGTNYDYTTRPISVNYFPNRNATRAEVFGFARNILWSEKLTNTQASCKIEGVEIYGDCKIDHGDIRYGKYIETQIYWDNLYQGLDCAISYENQGNYMIWSPKPGKYGEVEYIDMSYLENWIRIVLGNDWYYEISSYWNIDNCMDVFLLDVRKLTAKDVLNIYYGNLDKKTIPMGMKEWAYRMRSPAGVSEETFMWWYKNVTSVVFREDTLSDLDPQEFTGKHVYEFLVDMTENGVKSTYKVKSEVDIKNFQINNLSSVKQ